MLLTGLKEEIFLLIFSLALACVLIGADQLIKYLVVLNFDECRGAVRTYYTLSIGDFDVFSLTHIRNDGAAWSILGGQTILLVIFTSVVMLAILVYMIVKRKSMNKLETLALAVILAGGIGNLIDRARILIDPDFSGVIDYILLDFLPEFPVFNFADICIVVGGIGLCLIYLVLEIRDHKRKKLSQTAATEAHVPQAGGAEENSAAQPGNETDAEV